MFRERDDFFLKLDSFDVVADPALHSGADSASVRTPGRGARCTVVSPRPRVPPWPP